MAKRKTKAKKTRQVEAQEEEGEIVIPEYLPVLPAKDLVAFPGVMMSFYVGRSSSISAVEAAAKTDNLIFVVAQRDHLDEEPKADDLYRVGVVANVARVLKVAEDRFKILIQGLTRARAVKFIAQSGLITSKLIPPPPIRDAAPSRETKEAMKRIRKNITALVEYNDMADDLLMVLDEVDEPGMFTDLIMAHLKPEPAFAQTVLEEFSPLKRLKMIDSRIHEEFSKLMVHEQIRDKAHDEMTKGQREFFLREQLKQIRHELGEEDDSGEDMVQLKKSLEGCGLPKLVLDEAMKQYRRLERMSPEASDASLVRTYLEWIVDLPWARHSVDRLDLKVAKQVLDRDHYGLTKVKDRILEFLSVRKLNKDSHGPILCLVGPPGVGKTSLGRSVATALQRSFVRMSLGGIRDEAEIRGHRRTYVGALPGRVLQGMKQAGTKNPVFVLDELDKVGADFRGDPASALLEVLDPQQNKEFSDHYLNVPFDLSEVMFFATANTIDTIPEALLDRLEVIHIPGYTTPEKLQIAKRFLVPRQLKENGLNPRRVTINNEALLFVIERYTREAGVRNLEREIGSLCRKVAREYAEKGKLVKKVSREHVLKFLGPTRFDPEANEQRDAVGVVHGLAWTVYGGETMPIEVSVASGSGKLTLTGQLGEVMQESAQAAMFYARANAATLGLDPEFQSKLDIHVHVPQGATPKDGPSAGITIATALVSALSGRPVYCDLAMTGEITLRGNVLPVGGIKEKALAAIRLGLERVIIPFENVKDLEDIDADQRRKLKFFPVKHIGEVLSLALHKSAPKVKKPEKKSRVTVSATV